MATVKCQHPNCSCQVRDQVSDGLEESTGEVSV
jgi:hypothetical protein